MTLEYRLNYGKKFYDVRAGDFSEALKILSERLNIDIKENQVRISTVVRIE